MLQKMENMRRISPYDRAVRLILPIIPKRIRPNHLTFVRLAGTPILILVLVFQQYLIGLVLFIILALTDLFDGAIARLRNQITTWGKIWDPVADKVLISSVVVVMLLQINFNLTILIVCFEVAFILGGTFQKIKVSDVDIMANTWGKIKMNLQCLGGLLLILGFFLAFPLMIFIAELCFYLSLFFAVISLLTKGI